MYVETLKLILSLDGRAPHAGLPAHLAEQFARLAQADLADPEAVEDAIWALWVAHPRREVAEAMQRAVSAIARRQYDVAETRLNELVIRHADYAEAWNKRATLYFVLRRDDESIADIARTLLLEPRHFGAICGFGQIALRRGDRAAALSVFEAALRIHPHLADVRDKVEELRAGFAGRIH